MFTLASVCFITRPHAFVYDYKMAVIRLVTMVYLLLWCTVKCTRSQTSVNSSNNNKRLDDGSFIASLVTPLVKQVIAEIKAVTQPDGLRPPSTEATRRAFKPTNQPRGGGAETTIEPTTSLYRTKGLVERFELPSKEKRFWKSVVGYPKPPVSGEAPTPTTVDVDFKTTDVPTPSVETRQVALNTILSDTASAKSTTRNQLTSSARTSSVKEYRRKDAPSSERTESTASSYPGLLRSTTVVSGRANRLPSKDKTTKYITAGRWIDSPMTSRADDVINNGRSISVSYPSLELYSSSVQTIKALNVRIRNSFVFASFVSMATSESSGVTPKEKVPRAPTTRAPSSSYPTTSLSPMETKQTGSINLMRRISKSTVTENHVTSSNTWSISESGRSITLKSTPSADLTGEVASSESSRAKVSVNQPFRTIIWKATSTSMSVNPVITESYPIITQTYPIMKQSYLVMTPSYPTEVKQSSSEKKRADITTSIVTSLPASSAAVQMDKPVTGSSPGQSLNQISQVVIEPTSAAFSTYAYSSRVVAESLPKQNGGTTTTYGAVNSPRTIIPPKSSSSQLPVNPPADSTSTGTESINTLDIPLLPGNKMTSSRVTEDADSSRGKQSFAASILRNRSGVGENNTVSKFYTTNSMLPAASTSSSSIQRNKQMTSLVSKNIITSTFSTPSTHAYSRNIATPPLTTQHVGSTHHAAASSRKTVPPPSEADLETLLTLPLIKPAQYGNTTGIMLDELNTILYSSSAHLKQKSKLKTATTQIPSETTLSRAAKVRVSSDIHRFMKKISIHSSSISTDTIPAKRLITLASSSSSSDRNGVADTTHETTLAIEQAYTKRVRSSILGIKKNASVQGGNMSRDKRTSGAGVIYQTPVPDVVKTLKLTRANGTINGTDGTNKLDHHEQLSDLASSIVGLVFIPGILLMFVFCRYCPDLFAKCETVLCDRSS